MATVNIYQATDMLSLPTSFSSNYKTLNDVSIDNFATTGYPSISLIGNFAFDPMTSTGTGTATAAAFNCSDNDRFPNILISDMNFVFDYNYISTVIGPGNIAAIVSDILSGNDNIIGSSAADTLDGFAGADKLQGRGGDDHLVGDVGADVLLGGQGNDTLYGGAGKDTLVGGPGADDLTGNGGADTFRFNTVSDSPDTIGATDTIEDFTRGQGDKIDLSHIDANTLVAGNQAFEFIGTGAFTGNATDSVHRGELRYVTSVGGLLVLADVNGDKVADFAVDVVTNALALHASDFIL